MNLKSEGMKSIQEAYITGLNDALRIVGHYKLVTQEAQVILQAEEDILTIRDAFIKRGESAPFGAPMQDNAEDPLCMCKHLQPSLECPVHAHLVDVKAIDESKA